MSDLCEEGLNDIFSLNLTELDTLITNFCHFPQLFQFPATSHNFSHFPQLSATFPKLHDFPNFLQLSTSESWDILR